MLPCKPFVQRAYCLLICVGLCVSPSSALYAQEPEAANPISEVAAEVAKSQQKWQEEPSLANHVRLATWQILLGEIATDEGEKSNLWTLAVDQIQFGLQSMQAIEEELAASPEEQQRLSNSPELAMRFDAARVRQVAIEQREALARDAERERLNQLREIAKNYRTVLTKSAEADLYLRLEDMKQAREANLEVLNGIKAIYAITKSRQDVYLFQDEPQPAADSDFAVLNATINPFNLEMIAHVKAVQALATCRLALQQNPIDQQMLNEARSWAMASLDGTAIPGVELPEGHDGNNPIGLYTLAMVSEAQAVEQVRPNPGDITLHKEAAQNFASAKELYGKAQSQLEKNASDQKVLSDLRETIEAKLADLDSSTPFFERANKETLAGQPGVAWEILQDGTIHHRETALWVAMVEAARRAVFQEKVLLAAIQNARDSGLFLDSEPGTQILRMKVVIDAVRADMSQSQAMSAEQRQARSRQLQTRIEELRTSLESAKTSVLKAEGQAFLALAIAYSFALGDDNNPSSDSVREAHRYSRDAMAELEAGLAMEKDAMKAITIREALIASRLAYGYLAIKILPDYRDDASLAFAAALDEIAKLPFSSGNVELLGSPTISAITSRGDQASAQLALEERRYRELVTRFLESMYTLQFGNPNAAAEQMTLALSQGGTQGNTSNKKGPLDAGEMLGKTDGFDSQVTLQDSVRAFAILADIEAQKHEKAILDSVRLLSPDSKVVAIQSVDTKVLDDCLARIQSPIVGFAFGTALEAYANHLELSDGSQQEKFASRAKLAFDQVKLQLQSRRMSDRYPHLLELVQDAEDRLGSIQGFVEEAKQLQQRGDWSGAIRTLNAGLKRHPHSSELWVSYLQAQLEVARRSHGSKESLLKVLKQLEMAYDKKMISAYEYESLNASLLEQTNELEKSLDAYLRALANATKPEDKIRARSKVSELRVRLITSSNR